MASWSLIPPRHTFARRGRVSFAPTGGRYAPRRTSGLDTGNVSRSCYYGGVSMDILERILDAGLPVLVILAAFAVWAYADALKHAKKG